MFYCCLLFFLFLVIATHLILSIISGLKKQMMQIVLFFVRNFSFDLIWNFSSQIGEKCMFRNWEHHRIWAIKSTQKSLVKSVHFHVLTFSTI
jgi:hypothetical protein